MILGTIYLEQALGSAQDLELLRILANQAAVAIQNIRLYDMAALDPLTGVHARRFFETWIQKELRAASRNPQPVSLLMIDVDHMKEINATAGHLGGDRALRRVGDALRAAIRDSDVVGRYGGDEFAIILPYTELDGALQVGERILASLAAETVGDPDDRVDVRCSIGASSLCERSYDRSKLTGPLSQAFFKTVVEALIRSADEALYLAKSQGGARFQPGAQVTWPDPPG